MKKRSRSPPNLFVLGLRSRTPVRINLDEDFLLMGGADRAGSVAQRLRRRVPHRLLRRKERQGGQARFEEIPFAEGLDVFGLGPQSDDHEPQEPLIGCSYENVAEKPEIVCRTTRP